MSMFAGQQVVSWNTSHPLNANAVQTTRGNMRPLDRPLKMVTFAPRMVNQRKPVVGSYQGDFSQQLRLGVNARNFDMSTPMGESRETIHNVPSKAYAPSIPKQHVYVPPVFKAPRLGVGVQIKKEEKLDFKQERFDMSRPMQVDVRNPATSGLVRRGSVVRMPGGFPADLETMVPTKRVGGHLPRVGKKRNTKNFVQPARMDPLHQQIRHVRATAADLIEYRKKKQDKSVNNSRHQHIAGSTKTRKEGYKAHVPSSKDLTPLRRSERHVPRVPKYK